MKNVLNVRNIFEIILVLVIVFLLLKTCTNKPVPKMPVVTTVAEIKERIVTDSVPSKKYRDSIEVLIMALQQEGKIADDNYSDLAVKYNMQANELHQVLNTTIPDTCKPYIAALDAINNQIVILAKQKDLACENAVNLQKQVVVNKDKIISKLNTDKATLTKAIDTLSANQNTLSKALAKFKPKRHLNIGVIAISNYNNFNNAAVGIGIDYLNKKGTTFGIGYFNTKQIQASYKVRLF